MPDFPIPKTGLSVDFPDLIYARGRVELSKYKVSAGDELDLKFIFENVTRDIKYIHVTLTLPEGFSADVTESVLCLQRKEEEKDDFITLQNTVLPEAKKREKRYLCAREGGGKDHGGGRADRSLHTVKKYCSYNCKISFFMLL